jgi:glycosyltransferase involved in cell wall biosynthesis
MWDKSVTKPFTVEKMDGVFFYKRSQYTSDSILKLVKKIQPNIAYISGWQDKGYLKSAFFLKKSRVPVVIGIDDQWRGTLRQVVGSIVFRCLFKKLFFTHAWVSGDYQYLYAKIFGFKDGNIIFNLLSADSKIFKLKKNELAEKKECYPKEFYYIGNFSYIKGTDLLIDAYYQYKKNGGDWGLTCVGNGPQINLLNSRVDIKVQEFQSQESLAELTKNIGCLILPSRSEQWGVVVHEFARCGIPLILSSAVGCVPTFLIDGHNGYSFAAGSVESLSKSMTLLSTTGSEDLVGMGLKSSELGNRLTTSQSAASFMSILHQV